MTDSQFNISVLICWLTAYLMYLAICIVGFLMTVEWLDLPIVISLIASTICAVLFGWLCLKASRVGILYGLTIAALLFTIIKIGAG